MSSAKPSRFTRRHFFQAIGGIVAMVFGFFLGLRAYEDWRGARVWTTYRAAAEQRGTKLWLKDFIPPGVPDAENFAANPMIQDLFAAARRGQTRPNPLAWPPNFKPEELDTSRIETARRIDLAKWRDALAAAGMIAQPTDNPARDVLEALSRYAPVLAQLHTAGLRPHSRFPMQWEKNMMAAQPHYGFLQDAARLDRLRMAAHLALADSPAAYADWREGLALYHALEHEPTLIAGLVRVSIMMGFMNTIWDGLAGGQWAEPELRFLSADLASLNILADWQFTLASERGLMNTTLEDYITRPRDPWRGLMFWQPSDGTLSQLGTWDNSVGGARQSQAKMNELYDQRLAHFDVAHGVLSPHARDDEQLSALRRKGLFTLLRYRVAYLFMPVLDSAETKFLHIHSTTRQARVACALELFRRTHHAFPERLDELVPDFLDAVPPDVMDGAPLRYRRVGESYQLWSIAVNRQDDGGETGPFIKSAEQLDWIWRY